MLIHAFFIHTYNYNFYEKEESYMNNLGFLSILLVLFFLLSCQIRQLMNRVKVYLRLACGLFVFRRSAAHHNTNKCCRRLGVRPNYCQSNSAKAVPNRGKPPIIPLFKSIASPFFLKDFLRIFTTRQNGTHLLMVVLKRLDKCQPMALKAVKRQRVQ